MTKKSAVIYSLLRKSHDFDVSYVKRMKKQIEKHMPDVEFRCVTNADVEGVKCIELKHSWNYSWSKMEIFSQPADVDIFYVDLDVLICKEIYEFLNFGKLALMGDFFCEGKLKSTVMYLPKKERFWVWEKFIRNKTSWMSKYGPKGESRFIQHCLGGKCYIFQDVFPNSIICYKKHQLYKKKAPKGARIVTFTGRPRPKDLNWEISGISKGAGYD